MMDDKDNPLDIEWVPFALTHVEFPKGDFIGKIFAIFSLMPMGIIAGFIALILFRRDLHTITFFIGLLSNETLNMILKYTIRESRPMHRNVQYTEFGMPSSHSQLMWFFAMYSVYFTLFRMHKYPAHNNIRKFAIIFIVLFSATCVAYSRIYLLYHTWSQILWGGFIGLCFASFWFILTQVVFTPRFQEIASWTISEKLLIRDTTLIPNILWFEYTNTRIEARSRSRKLSSKKSYSQ